MSQDTPKPLQFRCGDFRDQVVVLSELAGPLLDAASSDVLRDFRDHVEQVRIATGGVTLEIPPHRPVRTVSSDGDYERSGKAAQPNIHAELTCRWDVTPIGNKAKGQADRLFEISGIASSVVALYVSSDGDSAQSKVASWRMEIGNPDSPGACFHTQIPDSAGDHADNGTLRPWPHWLPVPRLFSLPFTPMFALDYVLGELFQSRWRDRLQGRGAPVRESEVQRWDAFQRVTLRQHLDWQVGVLDATTHPTALQRMKWTHPPADLLAPRKPERARPRAAAGGQRKGRARK